MRFFAFILVLFFAGTGVRAQANALSYYESGQYHQAIELGESEQEADAVSRAENLVFAARSRLALIDLGRSENHKRDAKAALTDAEKAMKLDPNNAEAHLMKVAALGILARGMSKMKSFRKGIAGKSRRHIEAAMALDPQSAWARAMLGMWHLEIIRRGGKFGARVTGANAEEGAKDCALAHQSKNFDAGMGTQCGLALLLSQQDFQAEAVTILRQASQPGVSPIAYNIAMSERAREILDILDHDGLQAAQKRALVYLNYTAS